MKFITALCGGASLLAVAAPAFAQQAPTPAQLDTVVVTGSRIVRNGYAAPTPITVAPIEQLQQTTPSSIPDALNKLPQFAFSANSAGNGSVSGPASIQGGAYLNLRGFGITRTLVLLDGRRVPTTSINNQVDVNTLPQMLVQRVDVVTGGASAVYGSDAITGVVNFVLDKRFNGLKAVVQGGTSSHSDSNSSRIGVAGGGAVTDKGHFIWSAERAQNDGVRQHEDRAWASTNSVYVGATGIGGAGSATNPFVLVQNARISNASFGGLVTAGPASVKGQQFLSDGTLGAFNPGAPTTQANVAVGGDGAYFARLNLTPPTITTQVFGRFEYELTNQVSAYLQLAGAETEVYNMHTPIVAAAPFTITNDNPYLTAAEKAAMGASSITVNRLVRDLTADAALNQKIDALNFTGGLTGTLGDYKWEAYYTHGQSLIRSKTVDNISYANLYAAVDAVKDSSGNIVCRVSLTANAALYPGCAPANILGSGNISSAAKTFLFKDTQFQAVNKLDDFAGSISGNPFNNWAGPVSVAFNYEYRVQSLVETSNVNPLAVPSYTALLNKPPTGSAGLTTFWAYSVQGASGGRNRVWETSAETAIPLVTDAPFAKSLEASGAVRYTDYSSSGATRTWKYGLNYQPINDLRIRWTESQDIRAPSLNDMFAPTQIANVILQDPISKLSGTTQQLTGGNPNLVPEVARTSTVGFVYSPHYIPRLRMSLDYYKIEIANALSSINGTQTAVLQECANSGGTSPVCAAAVRATPTSFPLYVTNYTINAAKTATHGIDVEASYSFEMADLLRSLAGHVDLRLLYAYQPDMTTQAYPGAVVTQSAGVAGGGGIVGFSAHRVTSDLTYKVGPVTVNWEGRYLSGLARSGNPTQFYVDGNLPAIFYHDLGLNYAFNAAGHAGNLFLTVNNVLDQNPRISPQTNFTATPGRDGQAVSGDDIVGRYYTVGLRIKY
ncbi:MAG: TonB-dependent receptor [Caulobacteraceae bacterium]|nr:TonB-dependent receptor [Caulobacteraceae bacterium]